MPEDIEAAGLSMHNLNELTEEQFNNLVMIAERRQSGADSAASSTLQQREPYGMILWFFDFNLSFDDAC